MNTTIKTLLTFAITIITISLNAQSQLLTPEELFIFHMSAYNQQPSGAIFLSNWLGQYISKFDSHNYNQAKNDEFQLHTYLESQNKRLLQKIQEANYTKLYYLSTSTTLGEYNFNSSTFPISFNAGSMDDGGGMLMVA